MDRNTAVTTWSDVCGSDAVMAAMPPTGRMLEEFAARIEAAERERCELALKADACIQVLRAIVEEQDAMGFDGSPSDELMDCARSALG